MEKVVIFGNSLWAETIHFYLTHDSPYEVAAFTVDQDYIKEGTLFGLPVVPFEDIESAYPPDEYKMSVPLGYIDVNKLRAEKYSQAKARGYQLISYVSSKAIVWPGLVVGDNCFILETSVIQPFAEIGNNVIIAGSAVGHHSIIKEHCFLSPHAVILGGVTVEPYCLLGANVTIKEGVVVARECLIGANALITKDTQERGVYIGKPAEFVSKPSNELGALLTWHVR